MRCPSCGRENDAATGITGQETPDEGAVSICFGCAQVAVFTGNGLEVRLPTPEERESIMADTNVNAAIAAISLQKAGLLNRLKG